MVFIEDNISADLDLAMFSRRNGAPGDKTPKGILTKFNGTAFDRMVKDIESLEFPHTLDFGFLLLEFGSDLVDTLNNGISTLAKLCKKDGKHHDFVMALPKHSTGLTIHCNADSFNDASDRLHALCLLRKYEQKASSWFGVCISPKNSKIKFGVSLSEPWEYSAKIDEATRNMPKPQQQSKSAKHINFTTKINHKKKIGRNEKCSCGSEIKYKNCCLHKVGELPRTS